MASPKYKQLLTKQSYTRHKGISTALLSAQASRIVVVIEADESEGATLCLTPNVRFRIHLHRKAVMCLIPVTVYTSVM
jgi:hypothetical protein